MPRIHQLPPHVVSKIAAGEVIERPASVVKELLENSIDAGSTRIDIDLDQGGTELIRIVDDGCGIVPEDLELAFAPHATSKLKSADDLFAIGTMGFRGEALSSIGGVGKVTLQSRPHDQPCGAELRCEDGAFAPVRPWNGSPGTRMEVRHLFYNVPARKKFLKSVATELGHVCETVTRLALANPTLHLTLRHNNKLVYDIPGSASLTDRIGLFFGAEVRDGLYEIESVPGTVGLRGYIGDPKCDRGNSKLQYLFVNGRWFRDRSVAHAFQEAYRGLLMSGRYAVGFLFLTLPPDKLDVNVHPTKSEVRFQENSLVYSLVRSTVKARLAKENLVPHLTVPDGTPDAPEADPVPPPGLFASPRQDLADRTVAPWEMFGRAGGVNPPVERSVAETPTGVGIHFADPAHDTLPTDPADPRVADDDHDGKPGITVHVNVSGSLEGDLYIARRERFAYDVTEQADHSLTGTVEDHSEQLILGATDPVFNIRSDWTQMPDLTKSPIFLKPVGKNWDCTRLMAARATLFPPAPKVDW